jgi:hypothetical protein
VQIFAHREKLFIARRKMQIHDGAVMCTPNCELVCSVCGYLGEKKTV